MLHHDEVKPTGTRHGMFPIIMIINFCLVTILFLCLTLQRSVIILVDFLYWRCKRRHPYVLFVLFDHYSSGPFF